MLFQMTVQKIILLIRILFLSKQEITQTTEERMIKVAYPDNKVYNEAILPTSVLINTFQKRKHRNQFEYNSVSFNEELSFSL
jgi:hypothetical protein